MRVLVTGASGFLGRHLLPLLREHEVLILAHPSDEFQSPAWVKKSPGDLSRDGSWQREIERFAPEWCIHLAWEGLPDYSFALCRKNLDSSLRLIATLVRARVRRVVVSGSCWEYGRAAGPVAETKTLDPDQCGVFAATKHALRMMLDSVARDSGFDYRWARVFFVYGPGQRPVSLIPYLAAAYASGTPAAIREPRATQDFVHVDDVARGFLSLAQYAGPSGVFNLGSGTPTSVGQVANLVALHCGQPVPFERAEAGPGFWADTSRTFSACGWRAEISLSEGIAATIKDPDGVA